MRRQGKHRRLAAALAACLLAAAPMAEAGSDDDALLQQVKQAASKGQNAQTAAQINQYVDQNQGLISAILKGYLNYLNQIQSMTAVDGTGTPQPAAANAATAPAASGTTPNTSSGAAATTELQPSTGLQINGLQPSGELQTSHLAGYPALPDVEPVSSVTQPTAAQLEYAAQVQKEMQARKQYLMEHPEGYTY
jgi:murein L,D-transpeptidase YcbB/YkuD